jgi:hypothetical protein
MNDLITSILQNKDFITGYPASKNDIANRLILLQACEFAPPPLEYIQFLTEINGIHSTNARLYGCYEKSDDLLPDFIDKNLLLDRSDKMNIIILGCNTMDYLAYNRKEKIYETRDIDTDQVTFTFVDLKDALSYFFDLEEE